MVGSKEETGQDLAEPREVLEVSVLHGSWVSIGD